MARKFEVKIHQWLPHIIHCYFEYENLNTLEIIKQTGGIIRVLGNANEQLAEINSVLDFLVKAGFLEYKSSSTAHYHGIDFQNVTYIATSKFIDFIQQAEQTSSDQPQKTNVETQPIQLTKNVYNLNITFAVEKLVEFKTGLLNF